MLNGKLSRMKVTDFRVILSSKRKGCQKPSNEAEEGTEHIITLFLYILDLVFSEYAITLTLGFTQLLKIRMFLKKVTLIDVSLNSNHKNKFENRKLISIKYKSSKL